MAPPETPTRNPLQHVASRIDLDELADRLALRHLVLVAVVGLGLWLRLEQPLSTPIITSEDPYMHMARTWDILHGNGFPSRLYPPGFYILLLPLAAMGPEVFYHVARLGPPLIGGLVVLTTYLLCRERVGAAGALTAGLLVAVSPEVIKRTSVLHPPFIELVLLPLMMWWTLRAVDGGRWALWGIAGSVAFLLPVHPWSLALYVPVAGAFAAVVALREGTVDRRLVAAAGIAGVGLLVTLLFVPGVFNPARDLASTGTGTLVAILQDPAILTTFPPDVDLSRMLTVPALVLGGVGALVALAWDRFRDRFAFLGLLWVGFTLPFVIVDWFGVPWVSERVVVYLFPGLAMLIAVGVEAVWTGVRSVGGSRGAAVATVLLLAGLTALTLPTTLAEDPWGEMYEPHDYEAWGFLADQDPGVVQAGSWPTRVGYEAMTGHPAVFDEAFWREPATRERYLAQHPGTYAIVDNHVRAWGMPTGFLDGENWRKVGTWGSTSIYEHTG